MMIRRHDMCRLFYWKSIMMKISAALVFCLLAPVSSLAETSLPNIVIYFSDDHSAFDMGAFGNS